MAWSLLLMRIRDAATDLLLNLAGIILYAGGIIGFIAPHQIAPGGASGIAILVHSATGFPIGWFVFLFNLPLLLILARNHWVSQAFLGKTVAATLALAVVTDVMDRFLPAYQGDPLLAALIGGALMGIGMGLTHLGRANTGGLALLGLMIKFAKPQFRVGQLVSGLNLAVVLASGLVYRNLESMLYATVVVFLAGQFMDRLLEEQTAQYLLLVVSDCTDRIRSAFLESRRGMTLIHGEGGYSGEAQRVILCAVNKTDSEKMPRAIRAIDPKALIMVSSAKTIEGKGFGHVI